MSYIYTNHQSGFIYQMPTSITKYRQISATVFDLLVQLIRCQQQDDLRIIRRYITMMKEDGENKSAQLFDFLETRSLVPVEELKNQCTKYFGRSIQQRSSDLLNLIVYAMNTHYYTGRTERFSDRTRERARMKVWLDAADIIWQRNDTVALYLLDRVASQSSGLELYSEWQRALFTIREHASQRLTAEELEPISSEIKLARQSADAVSRARMLMHEAAHRERRITVESDDSWFKQAITELELEEQSTNSATVSYHRLLIRIDSLQRQHRYWEAGTLLKETYALTTNVPALRMPHLQQFVQLNQADNLLREGQFDAACQLSRQVQTQIIGEPMNWLQARKIEAEALFFLDEYSEARNIWVQLLNHPNGRWGDQADEMLLGLSASYFAEENYKESFKTLNEITILPRRNKSGFNLGVRALRCMNLIMMKRFDELADELERDQKYLQRLTGSHHIRPRDVLIMRILLTFATHGLDAAQIVNLRNTQLRQLAEGSDDCLWHPLTHEWIVFDQWLQAQVAGTRYCFRYPEYHREAMG